MSKRIILVFLALTLIFAVGCKDDKNPTKPATVDEFALVATLGDAYFSNFVSTTGQALNLTAQQLFENLQDGNTANDPVIIDYRSAADFATGRIRGAINITLANLVSKIEDGTIPKGKTILNVCYTGQNSSFATAFLNLMGYDAQSLMFGMCGVTTDPSINGTANWTNQIAADEFATQLVTTESTPTQTHAFPNPNTGKKTAEEIMKARFGAITGSWTIGAADVFANPANYFIINYWPKAEYLNPGHITGSFCFEPKVSLTQAAMLKYLPTDKTIVIYCYTGQTSAQLAAYLGMLGYNVKSLMYGMNGFAYGKMTKSKYVAPVTDYSAIIVK